MIVIRLEDLKNIIKRFEDTEGKDFTEQLVKETTTYANGEILEVIR